MSADTNRPKMSAPTPETDRIALLLENLDEWIDDSLRKSKPIGLTLCAARSTIADHRARITEMWDALETLRRERDEVREKAERYRIEANAMMMQRDEVQKKLEYYKERYEQLKEIPKWYNGREIPAEIKEETK